MLDLNRIREHPGELKRTLTSRSADSADVDALLAKDTLRRKLAAEAAAKKAQRNRMSQDAAEAKRGGASGEAIAVIMNKMRALGSEIAVMDVDIAELDDKIDAFLRSAPNYIHASVPAGRNAKDNQETYRWGGQRAFSWEAKPYWNIGSVLRILDFDDTAKLKGTQFTVYRDLGAQLERAVINYILDLLIHAGYREVTIPYMVMSDHPYDPQPSVLDERHDERIPQADQSIAALYRDRVLAENELPVSHCAFYAGFRHNAVNTGQDSGGLIGQRQFHKIELAALCKPVESYDALSAMSELIQTALRQLRLPYRAMLACTGELTHTATKTCHLEVWMPGYGRYIGVSSCSNCEDYIARRLNIRYQDEANGESRFCHTLSGSGVVSGRIVAAILENHQNKDGSVTVPEPLRSYMHTDRIL